jgi:hypothetical protein
MKYTKGDLYNFFDKEAKEHIKDFFKNKKEKYNKYTTVEINRLQWEEDCEVEKNEKTALKYIGQIPTVAKDDNNKNDFLDIYFEIRAQIENGCGVKNKKLASGNIKIATTPSVPNAHTMVATTFSVRPQKTH